MRWLGWAAGMVLTFGIVFQPELTALFGLGFLLAASLSMLGYLSGIAVERWWAA